MVYDIKDTPIILYRLIDREGRVTGYTADPLIPCPKQRIEELDDRDEVGQIQLHIFCSLSQAWSFREGLVLAGENEPGITHIEHGWVVVRTVEWTPEDPGDPKIKVVDCTDRVY